MANKSIFKDDSNYQEFAKLFESNLTDYNSRIITTNNTLSTQDKLTEAYTKVMDSLEVLNTTYSSSLRTKEEEIADTFIQALNLAMYNITLMKDFETFNNLVNFIKDMLKDDSPIAKLLDELQKLITLYANINKDTCKTASDRTKFIQIETLETNYSDKKFTIMNLRESIANIVEELTESITLYNQSVDEYNETLPEDSTNKKSYMNTLTMSDIDKFGKAYYKINSYTSTFSGSTGVYDSTKKYYMSDTNNTYYNNASVNANTGFIYDATYYTISPTLVYTTYPATTDKMYSCKNNSYTKVSDYINDLFTFYKDNRSAVNFPTTYYKITSKTEIDSSQEGASELYDHTKDYYTYDYTNSSYTLALKGYSGEQREDDPGFDGESTYYLITWTTGITLSNGNTLAAIYTDFITKYDDSYTFFVKYDGDGGVLYIENKSGWEFLKYLLTLNGNLGTTSLNLYRKENATLRNIKDSILAIHIEEREEIKTKIKVVINELLRLLNLDANNLALLPDGYELEEADLDGHCEISATNKDAAGNVISSAKSFYTKRFKGSRFYAYMGEVNRKGYVGQKAQVYGYIPVKQNSLDRLNKTVTISAPLMDFNNVLFKNNPKNVVYGLLNVYDYTADIQIENDGEGKNKKNKNAYVSDKAMLRFGTILSAKDIDIKDTKQSFRFKVDSNTNWTNGKIYKKGLFEISDVSVVGKFDDKLTGECVKYSAADYFSDAVSISMKITDINTGATYTYKSDEDLVLDDDYTKQENEKAQYKTSSYYKGTMSLTEDNKEESNDTFSFGDSKDIVLRVTPINNNITYELSLYLDPESDTNANYYEDSGNDPTVYLPMIASNFTIPSINVSSRLKLDTNDLKAISALLDMCNLFDGDFEPFDELMFANILNTFLDATSNMGSNLLEILLRMKNYVTGILTVNGIYKSYDPLYTETYITDILTEYSTILNKLTTYTSNSEVDLDALCSSDIYDTLHNCFININTLLSDIFSDVMEAENILHSYDNKVSTIMKYGKNNINLASSLAIFYDCITGQSQTVSTMNSTGQPIKTYKLNYSYVDWINLYDNIEHSRDYFIDTIILQYIYAITQTLKYTKDTTEKYNPGYKYIREFLKQLLLRTLKENIDNAYYMSDLFDSDIISIVRNYMEAEENIDCSFLDFNKFYINPYITELFPQLEKFNYYNLDDLVINDFKSGVVVGLAKPLIYKAILETNQLDINKKLTNMYNFMTNGQKLNVREVILLYGFVEVMQEINEAINSPTNRDDNNNSLINSCYSIAVEDFNKTDYIAAILEYRTLINKENASPISELMKDNESYSVYDLFNNIKYVDNTTTTTLS